MANEPNEDEPLFHAATYTQAPKVSHKVLTKEERQVLIKQHEEKQQEAAKLDQVASKGPVGRWWSRLQSGPNRITPAMAIVALGVVYGDIGTSPLYTMQTFLNGQGGLAHADREAVLGVLSLVFWSITLITTVKYVLIAMRIDNKGRRRHFRAVLVGSKVRCMACDSCHARRRRVPRRFRTHPGCVHQLGSGRLGDATSF